MRTRYKITQQDGIYFITSTIVEWIPVFTSQSFFEILIEALKFCRQHKGLKIYAYVILDNHFHLIVSGENLSKIVQTLKSFTSKKIIEKLKLENRDWLLNQLEYFKKRHKRESNYQIWQEGFHLQLILNEEMFHQKAEYLHLNPVRRGYVDRAEFGGIHRREIIF